MMMTKSRGRPPKEEPRFPDVTQMRDVTEAREPLKPPKAELLAQAIVRLNGDIRRASAEVLDPLSDPSYTEYEQLPEPIQKRVKPRRQRDRRNEGGGGASAHPLHPWAGRQR